MLRCIDKYRPDTTFRLGLAYAVFSVVCNCFSPLYRRRLCSKSKMHDVWLIVLFGFAGYLLRKADYPLAPLVLALVLGPSWKKFSPDFDR